MSRQAVLFESVHAVADAALLAAGLTLSRHAGALAPAELHPEIGRAHV